MKEYVILFVTTIQPPFFEGARGRAPLRSGTVQTVCCKKHRQLREERKAAGRGDRAERGGFAGRARRGGNMASLKQGRAVGTTLTHVARGASVSLEAAAPGTRMQTC